MGTAVGHLPLHRHRSALDLSGHRLLKGVEIAGAGGLGGEAAEDCVLIAHHRAGAEYS